MKYTPSHDAALIIDNLAEQLARVGIPVDMLDELTFAASIAVHETEINMRFVTPYTETWDKLSAQRARLQKTLDWLVDAAT